MSLIEELREAIDAQTKLPDAVDIGTYAGRLAAFLCLCSEIVSRHEAVQSLTFEEQAKPHCAKCKFRLSKRSINVDVDTMAAGDNTAELCPNGCGQLYPIAYQLDEALDRAIAAQKYGRTEELMEIEIKRGTSFPHRQKP